MRNLIAIVESALNENRWLGDTDAGSGGGWVDSDGDFLELDRSSGDTHASIAAQYFTDFEEYEDDYEERDDTSRMMAYEDAQSKALDSGWIRVTWRDEQEFGAEWNIGSPSQKTFRGLSYEIKDRGDFLRYNLEGAGWIDSKRKALQYVNRCR